MREIAATGKNTNSRSDRNKCDSTAREDLNGFIFYVWSLGKTPKQTAIITEAELLKHKVPGHLI